jgi:hypothetical protein
MEIAQILLHDWGAEKKTTLQPGNYDFPFHVTFDAYDTESIEGDDKVYHVYHLNATLERTGLARDVHISRHVRLVRTMGLGDKRHSIAPVSIPESRAPQLHLTADGSRASELDKLCTVGSSETLIPSWRSFSATK